MTARPAASYAVCMEVRLKPETQSWLNELANQSERPAEESMEDAVAAYLNELAETRASLDSRCEEIKTDRVKPIDGELFVEELPWREADIEH